MTQDICSTRTSCRICGSSDLRLIIDMGAQFLASVFIDTDPPPHLNQRYPLSMVRCGGACGLVQLANTINPNELYRHGSYGYRSGLNEMMRVNLKDIVAKVEKIVALAAGDTILDIGCNDGTLLDSYKVAGLDRIGFDPAVNIVSEARSKGLEVVEDFFSGAGFRKARPNRKARVVTSIAMFYDLEEPGRFVADVSEILADDGVWVIELSYLPFMLEKASFDTICHEHLEYYALRQIEFMLKKESLQVSKVEFNDVNGGSFRLFIRKLGVGAAPRDDAALLEKTRQSEKALGLDTERPYEAFRVESEKIRTELKTLLTRLGKEGKVIHAYGASTKGNTLLQYCGLDPTLIPKAADRNPEKWGRRTLGTNIPIVSEEDSRRDKPDYYLVLPWHFLEIFVKREEPYLKAGGKFILPLPRVRVAGYEELCSSTTSSTARSSK